MTNSNRKLDEHSTFSGHEEPDSQNHAEDAQEDQNEEDHQNEEEEDHPQQEDQEDQEEQEEQEEQEDREEDDPLYSVRGDEPDQEGLETEEDDREHEETRDFEEEEFDLKSAYKGVSETVKQYEEAYKKCIDDIPLKHYSALAVSGCVGEDYSLVIDDIDYEKRKIISTADKRVRKVFVDRCYVESGTDSESSLGCDLMEKDAVKMLWKELDFPLQLRINKAKYLQLYSVLNQDIFEGTVQALEEQYDQLDPLLEELYDYRMLLLENVKMHIDLKTQEARDFFSKRRRVKKTKTTTMQITSTLIQPPHYAIDLDRLPRPVKLNGETKTYAIDENPRVDEWAKNLGPQRFANVNNPNKPLTDWDREPSFTYQTHSNKLNL